MSETLEQRIRNCASTDKKITAYAGDILELLTTLRAERDEAVEVAKLAVNTGAQQAAEWDRFWEALGVKSADITVDQAIEKYKALQAENARMRKALEREHQSLCAYLDYAPPELRQKCYDPRGAYLAGWEALKLKGGS